MRSVIVSIALLLVLGCAKATPVSQEHRNKLKRIGIISLLGDKIKVSYFGLTVFNQEEKFLDIGFNPDKFFIKEIGNEIIDNTNINVVDISYDANMLMKVYNSHEGFKGNYYDLSLIKEELKSIIQKHSIDAIILVINSRTPSSTLHYSKGFGILKDSIVIYKECLSHIFAWALFIDGNTIETLTHFVFYQTAKLDSEYCPDKNLDIPVDLMENISRWFIDESKKGIKKGLKEIGLI